MSGFSKAANPGDIGYRLGHCLSMEEEAIAAADLETAANIQGIYADYLSAFMTAKEWATYEAMPGYAIGDHREREQVHADLSARRRYLLRIARDNNKWGRSEVEVGDASELDDMMMEAKQP